MNHFDSAHWPVHLLSGDGATVLVDAAGGGFQSRDGRLATHWSGDPLSRSEGVFLHLHDVAAGTARTLGRPRSADEVDRCTLDWEPGVAVLSDLRDNVDVFLEICVDPRTGAELRAATLANHGDSTVTLSLTHVLEPVLAPPVAHWSHPAFSKLFVQTEAVPELRALLARRRPRGTDETHPWLLHALPGAARVTWETDRAALIRRGRTDSLAHPDVGAVPFRDVTGNVLDSVLALRREVSLGPGDDTLVTAVVAMTPERDDALALAKFYADDAEVAAGFRAARAGARTDLERLDLGIDLARTWNRALAGLLLGHPDLASDAADFTAEPTPGDPVAPYAVLDARGREIPAPDRLAAMIGYWRTLVPEVELVVVHDGVAPAKVAGLRALHANTLLPRRIARVLAAAGLALNADGTPPDIAAPSLFPAPTAVIAATSEGPRLGTAEPLRHFNGLGGFSEIGDEYVIRLPAGDDDRPTLPPQPWINVIANEGFGCLVSETGAACTWSVNSRERRLTPWTNDALLDPHGESLSVHDVDTGRAWSAFPGPTPAGADYEVRHGFGVSRFRREGDGLSSEADVFVDADDPVRFTTVRLTNRGHASRRLEVRLEQRLVLGDRPGGSSRFVRTVRDEDAGLLLARNTAGGVFAGRTTVAAAVGGTLSQAAGQGTAAAFAQRLAVDLEPGAEARFVFVLIDAADEERARELAVAHTSPQAADGALERVHAHWAGITHAIQVETPSSALDLLVNGWLNYQTLSCRIQGRTAFYQSGGAYGFRDQLQDSTAFLSTHPEICREQILLHAAHQFVEGDVLHWWHPPLDAGIRTRFVDDLLWLPLLATQYVAATGDDALLDERAPLLSARELAPGEDEAFLLPEPSGRDATVYEHCCLALDRSLAVGAHGLPLFGCGDWNDGMNRVGRLGRGESVWMGFFLCNVIDTFVPHCRARGDASRVHTYQAHRDDLARALEDAGWDGAWYRRGYYDDGAPLGSQDSDECRIDALVQAWSVLSGVAPRERALQAVDSVERHLRVRTPGLVKLLTPPFVDTPHDPGYIKGYVAGVRENGGQYTHAALWYVRALAQLRRRDLAAPLLESLTPVRHAETPDQVRRYRVEPYVVAADVCGVAPHVGRGGWTWYTGSSCWMQRVAVESILGLRTVGGDTLMIDPCIPDDWPGFQARWRSPRNGTELHVRVEVLHGCAQQVIAATLDGADLPVVDGAVRVPVPEDGGRHEVVVRMDSHGGSR
jgi:cyclic beta-1,2-glucan synthetase